MSSKPWYAWFPSDYRAKTAHLTFEQDGAYRRLIDAYYERRGPLPATLPALYRLASAQSDSERSAVDFVAGEFFTNGDGLLRHSRCDEQIAKEEALHKTWVEAGRKGGLRQAQGRLNHPIPIPIPKPRLKPTSKEPASSDQEPSLSAADVVERLLLNDKSEWPVSKTYLEELERCYPAVDGPATLKEIRAWCISNPTKCKTRRGIMRFVNRWFERTQNA